MRLVDFMKLYAQSETVKLEEGEVSCSKYSREDAQSSARSLMQSHKHELVVRHSHQFHGLLG